MEQKEDITIKEELKELGSILHQHKKDNTPFELPANYFDEFPSRIGSRIGSSENRSFILLLKNWFSVRNLAFVAGLVAIFLVLQPFIGTDKQLQELSSDDLMALIDQGAIDFDEDIIYDAYNDVEAVNIETTTDVEDEEIIDYLLDEGVDVEGNFEDY